MSDCYLCKGTGYLKSYCEEPDRPCPCMRPEPSLDRLKEEAEELMNMPKGIFDNE